MVAEDEGALRIASGCDADRVVLPPRADLTAVKPHLQAGPVVEFLRSHSFDVIVVDMLDTPEEDMRLLASTGIPIVSFDDRGAGRFYANTLVNILVAEPDRARLCLHTRLLEGAEYVVLDPIFAGAHETPRRDGAGLLERVFVAMGGADAAGLTVKVARALRQVEGIREVRFCCGPSFPHSAALAKAMDGAPYAGQRLTSLPNLLDQYRWCDLAVVAGGLTMYECCCVGTPSLAVCQPIDHQLELADRLTAVGAMTTVGYGLQASEEKIAAAVSDLAACPARRSAMSIAGPAVVDGAGTARVATAIAEAAGVR